MRPVTLPVLFLASLSSLGLTSPALASPSPVTKTEEHNTPVFSSDTSFQIAQDSSGFVGNTFSPENTEKLRQELLIEPLTEKKTLFPPAPGSSLGIPTGYGANWGNAYIGGAFASARRTSAGADGSLSLGMGFGDSLNAVGLEVNLGIHSLKDSFGEDGAVGFKLHRVLDESGNFAAAVGWENAVKWGSANDRTVGGGQDSGYGVVTGRFVLQPTNRENQLPLTVSLGVGSGRFRSKGALDAGNQTIGVFASAGLQVLPEVSLITTWTGQELNMGASFAPFQEFPLVINLGAADVTNVFPEGTRLIFTAGYAITF